MRSRIARASSASRTARSLEVLITSRCRSVKAERQVSAPFFQIVWVVGPGELLNELIRHVVEVEGGVQVVPAEDLEGGQVVLLAMLGKVGEADLALLALAIVGDEKQVVCLPGGAARRCLPKPVSSALPG